MVLGYVLLALALGLTVGANVVYTMSRRGGGEPWEKWARALVLGATGSVVGASAYLIYLIATHQFQVAYVAEYSAKRSSSWYLFAAFWGGQEGSILLWTFWTAILGSVLAFKARARASRVWPIYGVVQVFLLCLLLMKCPFALGTGTVPLDGRGLNPLLENMWMVIHPPILFLGFASTLIPFAWCVYGLVHRDWDGWVRSALPWVLFSFASLGLGLSLGGYWAYETLGWGGFWAWDPVENSSLVPWLFLTALIHGILLQTRTGGYKISNFLFGFMPFATMFYGTFLTRSGLLSDFSFHSFSSLGQDGFYALLTGVLSSVLVPLGLLIWRFRQIPKPPAYEKVFTREFGFFLSSTLLGLLGLIVGVGMSAPLITKIWLAKGASAQPDFYNQGTYPLGILLTIAMAATPYLAWKVGDVDSAGKRLRGPYFAALAAAFTMTGFAWYLGVRKPFMVLMFATSMFAVMANIWLILPRLRRPEARRTLGGFMAHMGAGMLLAGVTALVAFSRTADKVMLMKDAPVPVMGYTLTYKGMTHHPYDRDRNSLRIEVEKNGRKWEALPRFFKAPWENKDTTFGNPPAVIPSLYSMVETPSQLLPWNNPVPAGDLYISIASSEVQHFDTEKGPNPNRGFELGANEALTIGDYTFVLRGLQLDERARKAQEAAQSNPAHGEEGHIESAHHENPLKGLPEVFVQASIEVTYKGKTEAVMPQMRLEPTGGAYAVPARIPGPDGRQVMLVMQVPEAEEQEPMRKLHLRTINAEDPTETVYVELSTKPLISFVWLGTLLYSVGGFVAYRRRARELGLLREDGSEATANEEAPEGTVTTSGKKKPRTRPAVMNP